MTAEATKRKEESKIIDLFHSYDRLGINQSTSIWSSSSTTDTSISIISSTDDGIEHQHQQQQQQGTYVRNSK